MRPDSKLWMHGFARSDLDCEKGTRTWFLPDSRCVELPDNAVNLYQVSNFPLYVGKIDDIFAESFRQGAKLQRMDN